MRETVILQPAVTECRGEGDPSVAEVAADETLVPRVRKLGLELHLGTGMGTKAEVLPLLTDKPESLSSDDLAQLD